MPTSGVKPTIFDHFQIGDISIGNKGIEGKDMALVFSSIAEKEAIQDAREREERRQRMQMTIIIATMITLLSVVSLLFYIFTKEPKNP
jgi:hypothetical protein